MSLVINKIEIENFVTIKEFSHEIGGDIFFVTGENRDEFSSDSNGAGKSLFLQAIGWALFDETPRKGLLKDDVIGAYKPYTRVCLTIESKGQDIVIDRVRKHPDRGTGVKVTIDGSEDLSKHSKAETDSFIEEILGINPKIFYYCVYADNDKEPLVALTSAKLNSVVSEILNTQRFDDYITQIRKWKKEKSKEHADSLLLRNQIIRELEECKSDVDDFEVQLREFETKRKADIEGVKGKIAESQKEKDEFLELLVGVEEKEKEYEEAKKDASVLQEINDALMDLKKKHQAAQKRLETANTRLQSARLEVDKAEEAYDNIFNNVSGSCHYCGNSINKTFSISPHAAHFSERRDKAKADLIEIEVDHNVRRESVDEILAKIEDLEEKARENVGMLKRLQKLERTMASLEQIKMTVAICDKTLTRLNKELKSLRDATPLSINQSLEKVKRRKEKIDLQIEKLTEDVFVFETEIEALKLLEDTLSSTKAGLFNSFIVELQEKINSNFQEMTEGDYHCSFEQRNEELMMVFTNTSKEGKYYPYWIFSRGERVKISKAASFALNDMMDIGLIIDDEGIEGVDDGGGATLLDFIIQKSSGKSLFFVSHKDFIKDYFNDYKNIHVVKEGSQSSIYIRKIGEELT